LEYAIYKVLDYEVELKLNRKRQLIVYADNVNLLRSTVSTVKKNTEAIIGARKDFGVA
jgi:hypothetical protein